VTRRAQVEAFAEAARQRFGSIDVIVNNAGVMPLSLMGSLKVEEWDRMIDVNIRGVLYGIAAVLPGMIAQRSGQIINIASVGALSVVPTAAVLLRDQVCGARDFRRPAPGAPNCG
jgi:NADP-dependent 3-hydroxy acid dehydrogenase YdfG